MSSPHTDVEKQEKRHKGPLIGMAVVAAFGVLLIIFLAFIGLEQGGEPEGADTQLETTTGDIEADSAAEEEVAPAPEQE